MARFLTLLSTAKVDLQPPQPTSHKLQSAHFHVVLNISVTYTLVLKTTKCFSHFLKVQILRRVKASIHKMKTIKRKEKEKEKKNERLRCCFPSERLQKNEGLTITGQVTMLSQITSCTDTKPILNLPVFSCCSQ